MRNLASVNKRKHLLAIFSSVVLLILILLQICHLNESIIHVSNTALNPEQGGQDQFELDYFDDEYIEIPVRSIIAPQSSEIPKFRGHPANLPLELQFENEGYGDLDEDLAHEEFHPHDDQPKDETFHPSLASERRYHALTSEIIKEKYSSFGMSIYHNKLINRRKSRCGELKLVPKELTCTIPKTLESSTYDMVKSLNDSRPSWYDDILTQIPEELATGNLNEYWYRFGGASVWLAEYGVHFLSNRIVYSPEQKNKGWPLVSLAYVQIFDSDWNELKHISLRIPTGELKDDKLVYQDIEFPSMLPIDFWYHNNYGKNRRYFGPEDPRILLVKNKLGYEEPMLVFNLLGSPDNTENNGYRAMYGYFPYSNRKVEFILPDVKGLMQKNWTPFVAESTKGYHEYIHFVYRYEELGILECHLETGDCVYKYKQDAAIKADSSVGEFRGGTPLIALPEHDSIKLPRNRKVWVGFARAHISKCGCGRAMYRPNLVILQQIGGTFYKISHVSGSMDFNIDVTGWRKPEERCFHQSVLIPNGISYWEIDSIKSTEKEIEDYLGLTVSVSDANVQILHIKGLLKYILSLPEITDEPNKDSVISGVDNVLCALSDARSFCEAFAAKNN